jgi:hypothetical protein
MICPFLDRMAATAMHAVLAMHAAGYLDGKQFLKSRTNCEIMH